MDTDDYRSPAPAIGLGFGALLLVIALAITGHLLLTAKPADSLGPLHLTAIVLGALGALLVGLILHNTAEED